MNRFCGFWVSVGLGLASVSPAFARAGGSYAGAAAAHSTPGYLGIDFRDVSDDEVATLHLRNNHGAEIIRVDHDGPAGKMGLRDHDVVIQLNGAAIDGREQMRRMLHDMGPGQTVALVIFRDGQQLTVTAQMVDRNQLEKQAWEQHLGPQAPAVALPSGEDEDAGSMAPAPGPAPSSRYSKSFIGSLLMSSNYTGAMLEVMGPQLAGFFGVQGGTGLLVRSVAVNSPAALAGLHAGDVVVRANARVVVSVGDWAKTIKEAKGRPVMIVVLRDRQEKTLMLTPDSKRHSRLEAPAPPTLQTASDS